MFSQDLPAEAAPVQEPRRVITNPFSGEQIVILTSGNETDGTLLVFELVLPPGKHVPSRHTHPAQEEQFTVLAGTMRFWLGWRVLTANRGDTVTVPRGVAHWFGNAGPEEARARVEVRPALQTQELFEHAAMLEMGEQRSLWNEVVQLPNVARMLLRFHDEVAVPDLPAWLVRPALSAVARLGRPNHADTRRGDDAPS